MSERERKRDRDGDSRVMDTTNSGHTVGEQNSDNNFGGEHSHDDH